MNYTVYCKIPDYLLLNYPLNSW